MLGEDDLLLGAFDDGCGMNVKCFFDFLSCLAVVNTQASDIRKE